MFSTVFLCVKEKNKYVFTCKEFKSFIEADHYFKNKYTVVNNNLTAVIPICKFMPQIIKRQVLQFKLSNIFNRVSII
jgi:hypothetical protein